MRNYFTIYYLLNQPELNPVSDDLESSSYSDFSDCSGMAFYDLE